MRTSKEKSMKTTELVLIALMATILCIVGPVTLPVGVVPVTTVTFVLYLLLYLIGTFRTFVGCLLYLCIGFVGLPVFSGYAAGPAVLFGPTGGYLIGYLLLIVCSGVFIERSRKKVAHFFGMLLGLLFCYLMGTVWLVWQTQLTWAQAFITGVVPFLIFDILKILIALWIGPVFRRHLRRANLGIEK